MANESSNTHWHGARWIVPTTAPQPGAWYAYRTTVHCNKSLPEPILRIACDSKYWLWIDGELAIYEGQLKRGPTPHSTYFDQLELPMTLSQGVHTIAVLVWYFGKHGFSHNSSGLPGLIASLSDASHPVLVSDSSWRVMAHPAYSAGDGELPNYRLPESNIAFDARRDIEGWQLGSFDDSHWPRATDAGSAGVAPWGELIARPIPMWRDFQPAPYETNLTFPFVSDGKPIVCALPFNLHASPILDIEAQADVTIDIRTENYTGGSANNVRGIYTTRAGRQSYESLGWMNGHAVHYTIPAGVVVHDLKYRRTAYDTPWLGRFDSDNDRVNSLWEKSCRTLDVCMRDTYMDCPDRERAQWWGDVVIQAESAFYACDATESTKLTRKGIHELIDWQRADHSLYSPIPTGIPRASHMDVDRKQGCWDRELPTQMLASIGWFGFWNYYRYTGDLESIARVYPAVCRYLTLWNFDASTGLVANRAGGWEWADWGKNIDMRVLNNTWYALALRGKLEMARLLGNDTDAQTASDSLLKMHDGFNSAFWKGTHYQSDAALPFPDDRAQAMAVLAGFVEPEKKSAIVRVFQEQRHAGPYMEKYIVEALLQLDEHEIAMERLLDRYAAQIDSPITTLWEGWSVGDAAWGGGTYNHAWSGGAITLFQQYFAGIQPITPAFEHFAARPRLGPLKRLHSVVPTRFGLIELRIDKSTDELSLVVPPGTRADLILPDVPTRSFDAGRHDVSFQSRKSVQ